MFIAVFALSSFAQEEQWTDYLGKSFDSVVVALKTQSAVCDTHSIGTTNPVLVVSCLPYEFLGEKGILVLRRSNKGTINNCSWVRGDYPGFKDIMNNVDETRREQLAVGPGVLDHVFSTLYNYYDRKWRGNLHSTDDGAYLWRPEQLKRKNVEYTMTRTLDYIEFNVAFRDAKKKAKRLPTSPPITGK